MYITIFDLFFSSIFQSHRDKSPVPPTLFLIHFQLNLVVYLYFGTLANPLRGRHDQNRRLDLVCVPPKEAIRIWKWWFFLLLFTCLLPTGGIMLAFWPVNAPALLIYSGENAFAYSFCWFDIFHMSYYMAVMFLTCIYPRLLQVCRLFWQRPSILMANRFWSLGHISGVIIPDWKEIPHIWQLNIRESSILYMALGWLVNSI